MDPMVLSVLYVWCQLNKDVIVNFWFGSQFKAMYLPWVLFAFNLIISGGYVPNSVIDFLKSSFWRKKITPSLKIYSHFVNGGSSTFSIYFNGGRARLNKVFAAPVCYCNSYVKLLLMFNMHTVLQYDTVPFIWLVFYFTEESLSWSGSWLAISTSSWCSSTPRSLVEPVFWLRPPSCKSRLTVSAQSGARNFRLSLVFVFKVDSTS